MSIATEIIKPNTSKIILCELNIDRFQSFWTNYRGFTWFVDFDNIYTYVPDSFLNTVSAVTIQRVGQVEVDATKMDEVDSAAECQATDSSFYWNALTKELYIHTPGGNDPQNYTIFVGQVLGFRKGGETAVYDGLLYEDRLLSSPNLSKSKDPLFFGIISFSAGNVQISNNDGAYDTFGENNNIFGNKAKMLLGFPGITYANLKDLYNGYIEKPIFGKNALQVTIQDDRKRLSRKIPLNVFSDSDYPNIATENIGKPIPLVFGVVKNIPVVCTNEDEGGAPANYNFKIADTTHFTEGISAITTVYVNGVSKATSATNLVNATFSIATANYDPGDEVTADVTGFLVSGSVLDNALDIIRYLKDYFLKISYTNTFYNLSRWDRANAPDIGLFIGDKIEISSIINDIASKAVLGDYYIEDDGRYAFRIFNSDAPIVQTLYDWELINVSDVTYDDTEILTSTVINYNKDWANNTYQGTLQDKTQETTIYNKYQVYREKVFDTLLTSEADAQDYSDTRLELSGSERKFVSITTDYRTIYREIDDIIKFQMLRPKSIELGWAKAEIYGKSVNTNNHTVNLACRIIELLNQVYFAGMYMSDSTYGYMSDSTYAYMGLTEDKDI